MTDSKLAMGCVRTYGAQGVWLSELIVPRTQLPRNQMHMRHSRRWKKAKRMVDNSRTMLKKAARKREKAQTRMPM
jgi:hypothetical protein